MTKRALITGLTGQDGSYLAAFLLQKGYEVVGIVRRSSTVNFERISHIQDDIQIEQGDLLDEASMHDVVRRVRPTEIPRLSAACGFSPTARMFIPNVVCFSISATTGTEAKARYPKSV